MTVRGLIRRWIADPITAVATVSTVALSLVLLAAGPIYSEAVAVGALRRSVTSAGDSTFVEVEVLSSPDRLDDIDDAVRSAIGRAFDPLDVDLTATIGSGESFELPVQDGELVDLAAFVSVETFEEHASLLEGAWPVDGAAPHQVVVDERVATAVGLAVGDELELKPRSGRASTAAVRVVGRYELVDEFDAFWTGREGVSAPVTETAQFRTVRLIATEGSMRSGLTGRTAASWLAFPSFTDLGLDDTGPIRRRVAGLEERLDRSVASMTDGAASDVGVATSVPGLLRSSERSLTVARSTVLATVLQLALLAGFALVLVAGLVVDARRAESAMLRARGAGSRQLLGTAVAESSLLVVPAALLAPSVAAWALRLFDEFGPLATIDMNIDPRPVSAAYAAVAVAAVVIITLLSLPAYRAARAAEQAEHRHHRQRLTSAAQRAGVDMALLLVSALVFWQLSSLDDARATSVRGSFGVDPLVIVAPTFGLVAGSFVAIRIVPALARLAERRVERSRSIVSALSGWQFARRPARYGRSGLLIIMAIAIGTFAVTYEATWLRSQREQADQQVGADARVAPNRRTNDSVPDLFLVGLHEHLDGVMMSVPVEAHDAALPGTDDRARLLAIDARRASALNIGGRDRDRLETALDVLGVARPAIPTIALPGEPTRLEIAVGVDDPGIDEESSVTPFRGNLVVVLQDGTGQLHRVELGVVAPGVDRLALELTVRAADGAAVTPRYPLALVDLEIRSAAPVPLSRDVHLDIGPIETLSADGARESVDLGSEPLATSATALGFLIEPAAVTIATSRRDGAIGLDLATGSTRSNIPVVFRITPAGQTAPTEVSAVVTRGWMSSSRSRIGDLVGVSVQRARPIPVRIVGVVDRIPTVDPGTTAGVLVDLPTFQISSRASGGGGSVASEHWLDVVDTVPEIALRSAPIEAVDVAVREQRRAELVSDPPSLGAIGALTLGFVAAAVFALVGFVVTIVVSARERRLEFALVRALGLSMGQLRRWMLVEQIALVVVGVLVGTVIGVGLGALVLPLVSLTQDGGAVAPPVAVTFPWTTIVALQAALVAGLAVGLVLVNSMIRRMVVGTALRAGSDA